MIDLISNVEISDSEKEKYNEFLNSTGLANNNYLVLMNWLMNYFKDNNIEEPIKKATIMALVFANYDSNKIDSYDSFIEKTKDSIEYMNTNIDIVRKSVPSKMGEITAHEILINQYKIDKYLL